MLGWVTIKYCMQLFTGCMTSNDLVISKLIVMILSGFNMKGFIVANYTIYTKKRHGFIKVFFRLFCVLS